MKTTSCAPPFFAVSRPFSITAEALPLPPRRTEPPAGTVIGPEPPAAVSLTGAFEPGSSIASSVSALAPLLKSIAETTAGPSASGFGCVITTAFWTLTVPTEVAALSGLTPRVWASLPAPQAESEAIENTMAVAARAPRRRLRLTAAATPRTYGRRDGHGLVVLAVSGRPRNPP
ncbi:hypothetical protein [Streptomyces lavendulocolor]|uniref:hypothetical protein n=1 Tax=Streptomyces lavendulocolor TaxID=67316 RepID=UPI003F4D39B8